MAGAKEIRSKIASIKNTQKITSAMEMVAASKMRKTQDRMRASKPYASKIYGVVQHLARAASEYRHPFMQKREVQRIGVIVVTSDRGLCGGLNANVLREVVRFMREKSILGQEVDLCVIGRKGQGFFRRVGGCVLASIDNLGDTPELIHVMGVVNVMLTAYEKNEIQELFVISNIFTLGNI